MNITHERKREKEKGGEQKRKSPDKPMGRELACLKPRVGTSLGVQWLRLHLPMQGV